MKKAFEAAAKRARMKMKKEAHKKHHPKSEHSEKWIQGAIKHPGALRKELHVKKGHVIPMAKLKKAAHAKGKEGKRARLALTLKKMHR